MQSPVLSTTTIEVYSLIHQHKHIDYTQRPMIASNRNHAINNLSSGSTDPMYNTTKINSHHICKTTPSTTNGTTLQRGFNFSNNFNPNKQQRINQTQEEDEINSTRAEYDEDEDNKVAFLD
ncbi:hypothetical protein EVAR_72962_1 [Eumeta japonica]|uniref:Uncharacterized protein n=1 Tax=Eumeta variegata TaxID=151549 RepID=A0A4C1SU99_EUMVA|nr:hypothetical protein EVAR_72962_1 [Eumeta japonica]